MTTVLGELLDKIGHAKPNQHSITISMEMAVKIAFAIERLEKIMLIAGDVAKHQYTELNTKSDTSAGE